MQPIVNTLWTHNTNGITVSVMNVQPRQLDKRGNFIQWLTIHNKAQKYPQSTTVEDFLETYTPSKASADD